MKRLFIRWCFCGTPAEYEQGKRMHFEELRIYRKRWYYILGLLLSIAPIIYLARAYETTDVWLCVASFAIGSMLVRDTISEHYVVKILRERKSTEATERNEE
ncbi:MAG TPA: hypothetical protein VIM57_02490 [Luteolibacter sp.]